MFKRAAVCVCIEEMQQHRWKGSNFAFILICIQSEGKRVCKRETTGKNKAFCNNLPSSYKEIKRCIKC